MGVIYYVSCTECRVTRDLDKFYAARPVGTREDALVLGVEFESEGTAFRAALLTSFMAEHRLHPCVLHNDHADIDTFEGYARDTDYWR